MRGRPVQSRLLRFHRPKAARLDSVGTSRPRAAKASGLPTPHLFGGTYRAVQPPSITSAWPMTKPAPELHSQKDGVGYFLGPAKPPDREVSQNVLHRVRLLGEHGREHWRVDGLGTDGINPDAASGVLQRGALRQSDDPVLGRVVGGPTGNANEAPIDELLKMAPLPCRRIWSISYLMQLQTLRRLIAVTRSNTWRRRVRFGD